MKKIAILLMLPICFVFTTIAQTVREISFNLPNVAPEVFIDAQIISPEKYFVSSSANIYFTSNNGKTWKMYLPLPNRRLNDFYAFETAGGDYQVFAATDSGVYKTNNFGRNWQLAAAEDLYISQLRADADYLYGVGSASGGSIMEAKRLIMISPNGGTASSTLPNGYRFRELQVTDGIIYLFVETSNDVKLLISTNQGSVWKTVSGVTNPLSFPFVDAIAYKENVFLILKAAGTSRYTVLFSSDTGNTFQQHPMFIGDSVFYGAMWNNSRREGAFYGLNGEIRYVTYNPYTNGFDFESLNLPIYAGEGDRYGNLLIGGNAYYSSYDLYRIYTSGGGGWSITNLNTTFFRDFQKIKTLNNGAPIILGKGGKIVKLFTFIETYFVEDRLFPPVDLTDASSPDDSTIFIIGKGRYLFRSLNGGTSFEAKQLNLPAEFRAVHFFNEYEGLLADDAGMLHRTTSGGDKWTQVISSAGGYSFHFLSADTGYMLGTKLMRTTDRGINWSAVATVNNPDYDIFVSLGFDKTGQYGFLSSALGTWKTTNFGASWIPVPNAPPGKAVFVKDQNNAEIFGGGLLDGLVHYSSTNGGQDWTAKKIYSYSAHQIAGKSPDNIWGLINNFGVFSNDNDYNTVVLGTPIGFTSDTVTAVIFADLDRYGKQHSLQFVLSLDTTKVRFLGLDDNENYLTNSWEKIHNFIQPNKLSVAAFGADSISGLGRLLGLKFLLKPGTYTSVPLKFDSFLFNSGSINTVTEDGKILRDSIFYGDVDLNRQVQAYDASCIVRYLAGIVELPGRKALRQADVTSDNTVSALDASTIARYVVGLIPGLPILPLMDNSGEAKFASTISGTDGRFILPLKINNAKNIFGIEGKISYNPSVLSLVSTSWASAFSAMIKESKSSNGEFVFAGASVSGITASETDMLYLTFEFKDANFDRKTEVVLSTIRLNESDFLSNSDKISISSPTDIASQSSLPKDYALYPNYPNPFNPSTTISFDLPKQEFVNLTVYDMLGAEVATLVNETLPAGRYEVRFDAMYGKKQLQAGVYLYQLKAGSFSMSRKMILLK